ncbi:predicted protein [Botrytis cinerea T4]|uniref:Uncharacterized protein n=1 Tax=Botryotinia fuckeliana (strain T4) TaxID=999810 RepID=G2XVH7_BOTF4|nr:predicted protein [Botrytis cinerea T4]
MSNVQCPTPTPPTPPTPPTSPIFTTWTSGDRQLLIALAEVRSVPCERSSL